MEYRKRFDLNHSIRQWKGTLSQNGALSPDNILELESHLLDEVDMLKTRGLNEEESFLVAQRRIGNVDALTSEYGKVNKNRRFLFRLKPYITGILIYVAFHSVVRVVHYWGLMSALLIPESSNAKYDYISIGILSAFIVISLLFLMLKSKNKPVFIDRLIKIPALLVIILIFKSAHIFTWAMLAEHTIDTHIKMLGAFQIYNFNFTLIILAMIYAISLVLIIQKRKSKKLAIQ